MKKNIGKVVIEEIGVSENTEMTQEEKKLEEIVSTYKECEYNQQIAREKNWAILFPLSHMRGNIIEWLPIKKGDRVLEIGSSYGALTGILADKSGAVTCLESSANANKINAKRNRDREGIRICQGEYKNLISTLTEKYDWIIMVGAFEAAKELLGEKDSWNSLLNMVRDLLSEKGKVVLASDNRLGLRYFAGCRERCEGKYFKGIEGYDKDADRKTFSAPELEKMLCGAGLKEVTFYYPYPDYTFPMSVYSKEHLPKVGELWDNLRNFDQERYVLFDEAKSFDHMIEDGLFPVFSNSFLVVAEKKKQDEEKKNLFSRYSNERSRKFSIRTDIWKDLSGKRHVEKCACYPEGKAHIEKLPVWMEKLNQVYEGSGISLNACQKSEAGVEVEFLTGETLEEKMDHLLFQGKAEEAVELLMEYIRVVRQAGSRENFVMTKEFEEVFGLALLPENLMCAPVTDIDMVAGNVICTETGWIHMDYEWTFDFPIPVNYVIYRIIQNYLYGNADRSALHGEWLYKKAGLTEQEISQYTCMEQEFQRYINGEHIPLRYLYEEMSPGCVSFASEEEQRQMTAQKNAQNNKGIEVFVDTFEIAMTGIHVNGWAVSKADKQVSFALQDEQGTELETVQTEYLYRKDVADQFKLSGKRNKAGFHLECRLPLQAQKNKKFTLIARDGISEVAFPIPVEKLRIKQSKIGKKLMDLRGLKDTIDYIAPHEMGLFGESSVYRVENQRFDTWRMAHRLTENQKRLEKNQTFTISPMISILLPVSDGEEKKVKTTLDSIGQQTWDNLEVLVISRKSLKKQSESEKIRWIPAEADVEKAQKYETGRKQAKGEWLLFMEPGDTLEASALYHMVKCLNDHPQAEMIYSDSDQWDSKRDTYFEPQFKPDDSPFTLQAGNYIGRSIWFRRTLTEKIGGFRTGFGKQTLYDLILRCRECSDNVSHISDILYHQNAPMERDREQCRELCREWDDGKKVLQNYFRERNIPAKIEWANYPMRYRVKWTVQGNPKVSIIIPNQDHRADLEKCLSSIEKRTTYDHYEVLVVENNSKQNETFRYYEEMQQKYSKVKLLRWEREFNYSAINNAAAAQASGEYLIFLNNDTEILTPDWIEEMLSVCQQKDVGVTGARLYYPDGTIQHAGVILGLSNIAGHLFVKEPGEISGYMGKACTMQNLSAVTAACMMVSAEVFRKVGGFEEKLQVALNDVDFCMKVQTAGKMVVYQPEAELYHYESKSRGMEDTPEKKARYDSEVAFFRSRWKKVLEKGDPYYNKNLSRTTWNCTFRIPPASERE